MLKTWLGNCHGKSQFDGLCLFQTPQFLAFSGVSQGFQISAYGQDKMTRGRLLRCYLQLQGVCSNNSYWEEQQIVDFVRPFKVLSDPSKLL